MIESILGTLEIDRDEAEREQVLRPVVVAHPVGLAGLGEGVIGGNGRPTMMFAGLRSRWTIPRPCAK